MKATVLINTLLDIIDKDGDLEVGVMETEFDCFGSIDKIEVRKTNFSGRLSLSEDIESLGDTFIGIIGGIQ